MMDSEQLFNENTVGRKILCGVIFALYAALFVLCAYSFELLPVENQLQDALTQHGTVRQESICTVGITAEDMETFHVSADVLAARVAEKLNASEERPAVIGLDLPLTEMPEEAEEIFVRAAAAGNLVFPVDAGLPEDARICIPLEYSVPQPLQIRSLPDALTAGNKEGHTVRIPDEDGVLRHAILDLYTADGEAIPSLAKQVYLTYCEKNGLEPVLPEDSADRPPVIRFADRSSGTSSYCTAGEFLNGVSGLSVGSGSIVYIGIFDPRYDGGYRTAADHTRFSRSAAVDADITGTLLAGKPVKDASLWMQIILLILAEAAVVFLAGRFRSAAGGFCMIAVAELSVLALGMLLFGAGINVLIFPHAANGILTGLIAIAVFSARRNAYHRRELEKVLGKYLDNRTADELIRSREEEEEKRIAAQGRNRKIAVMFADIRGFTELSAKVPGETLVRILNDFLTMMTESVERYGGTVDKYIGDCMTAYWGAPETDGDPVYHACLAAAEIRRRAEGRIGIGISYGNAVTGNVGSPDRMDYTVLGEAVNTAARLRDLAPGGMIYLSEEAAEKLGEAGELEKLPETVELKCGKEPAAVYSMKEISVRGGEKKKLREDHRQQADYRNRTGMAALVNFVNLLIQSVFAVNSFRLYGAGGLSYLTVSMAVLSAAVLFALVPWDLKLMEAPDGSRKRPGWLNILMLSGLTASLYTGLIVLFRAVTVLGIGAYRANVLPGGILICFFCPVLWAVSCLLLEPRAEYGKKDALLAELPPAAVLLLSAVIARRTGLDRTDPEVFRSFCSLPVILLSVLLQTGMNFLFLLLNRKLKLPEKVHLQGTVLTEIGNVFRRSKILRILDSEKGRHVSAFLINLAVAFLSVRPTMAAAAAGGTGIYSNPSLTGILIGGCGLAASVLLLKAMAADGSVFRYRGYKYLTFGRNLGCAVNFFSVFLLAVSGEGPSAFFTVRWSADFTVFLVCPLISVISWLKEQNDYPGWRWLLLSLPYAAIPLLTAGAVNAPGTEALYRYEIDSFYGPDALPAVVCGVFLLTGLLYLANKLTDLVFRKARQSEQATELSICGCRFGISGGMMTESEFGLRSECYVLRENDYGMVIGAGSGLEKAVAKLKGCTSVDVLLGSLDFRDLMGFLAAPKLCPGASLRIIAPFPMERFSVNPFWPVNLIRKNCVQVSAGKPFRLNDRFTVTFTPAAGSRSDYMIRLTGDITVCVTGRVPVSETAMRRWCEDADLLIYSCSDSWNRGCYYANDGNIPYLVLSGMPTAMPDSEILAAEQKAKKLYPEAVAAREESVVRILR